MKKLWKWVLSLCLAVSLTACGSKTTTDAQQKTVEDFLKAVQSYDMNAAKALCTTDCTDDFEILTTAESFSMLYAVPMFSGENFAKEGDQFIEDLYHSMISEYKIGDITVEDDSTMVNVSLKMYNLSNFNEIMEEDAFYELGQQLGTEHAEEVMDLYTTYGNTDEFQREILNMFAADFFGFIKERLESNGYADVNAVFTLEKDGDQWLISDLAQE